MQVEIILDSVAGAAVGAFPGAQIAPQNGARKKLVIQSSGLGAFYIYPQSGAGNENGVGILVSAPSGLVEMTDEEDGDLVRAEWWAFSFGATGAFPMVMELVEA